MIDVFTKRGNLKTCTHTGRTSSEREGRDQGDVSISQEMTKVVSNYQRLQERHGADSPLQPSEGTSPGKLIRLPRGVETVPSLF